MTDQFRDYSVESLLQFLDWAGAKGLMNPKSAENRKSACQRVFGILDAPESEDIRHLNLEDVFVRFNHLASTDLTPGTLRDYRNRVQASVREFLRYREDPSNYRPSVRSRSAVRRDSSTGSQDPEKTPRPLAARQEENDPPNRTQPYESEVLAYPFPLREDRVIHIQDIPRDLTTAEAKRIGYFIRSLAVDFNPDEKV